MGEINPEWLIVPTLSIERIAMPFVNPCMVVSLKWLPFMVGVVFYYQRDFNPYFAEQLSQY